MPPAQRSFEKARWAPENPAGGSEFTKFPQPSQQSSVHWQCLTPSALLGSQSMQCSLYPHLSDPWDVVSSRQEARHFMKPCGMLHNPILVHVYLREASIWWSARSGNKSWLLQDIRLVSGPGMNIPRSCKERIACLPTAPLRHGQKR